MLTAEELIKKILTHKILYASTGKEPPPYRLTFQENEVLQKNFHMHHPKNENLYTGYYADVEIELCVLVGEI